MGCFRIIIIVRREAWDGSQLVILVDLVFLLLNKDLSHEASGDVVVERQTLATYKCTGRTVRRYQL
jgi:hypothetical protein